MTKKFPTFALMAYLTSSLTFAGAQTNTTQSADDAKTASAQTAISANSKQESHGHSNPAKSKDERKAQHVAKPAPSTPPSTQEQEFDRVLLGIYG